MNNNYEKKDKKFYAILADLLLCKLQMYFFKNLYFDKKLIGKNSYNDFSADVNQQGEICKIELPSEKILDLKLDKKINFIFELSLEEKDSITDGWVSDTMNSIGSKFCKSFEKYIKKDIRALRKTNKNKQLCFAMQIIETAIFTKLEDNEGNSIKYITVYGIDFVDEIPPEIGNNIIRENQKRRRRKEQKAIDEKYLLSMSGAFN